MDKKKAAQGAVEKLNSMGQVLQEPGIAADRAGKVFVARNSEVRQISSVTA